MAEYKQGDIVVMSACPEAPQFEILGPVGRFDYRVREAGRPEARSQVVDEELIHRRVG